MSKVSDTLDLILSIIDADVRLTAEKAKGRLEPDIALKLTRYAATLSDIQALQDKEERKELNQLGKLPTDQLIELYQKTRKE